MKKKYTMFRPKIRSRHPSHSILRRNLPLLPFRSVVRLGSTTQLRDTVTNGGQRVECNTSEAIRNSASKLLMKQKFTELTVKTADWWTINGLAGGFIAQGVNQSDIELAELPYPIVAKHIYGSRGTGNTLINNQEELTNWLRGKTLSNYIFEKFYNYNREYRLHVTKDGCFYTCRKMLRNDTPQNQRWYRNDSNSVWVVEDNSNFDKPTNWETIVNESVKALQAVGLDVGAVDLRVQSAVNNDGEQRSNPDFIVVEINSAPSFGEITTQKYLEQIPVILKQKAQTK